MTKKLIPTLSNCDHCQFKQICNMKCSRATRVAFTVLPVLILVVLAVTVTVVVVLQYQGNGETQSTQKAIGEGM